MILVYAYYPFPVTVRGGWMRRIAAIDALLAGHPRCYVFPAEPGADPLDYRLQQLNQVHTDRLPKDVQFYRPDLRFAAHERRLAELIEQADFVYAHTSHSAQHLLPYYCTGKIFTDVHGIAPEEERMQSCAQRATFYESFEETMVRQSAALVAVTRAMADHFHAKYPGMTTPFIHLPIVDEFEAPTSLRRPERRRLRVVYAGGLQRWQNVDLMLSSIGSASERYEFTFYTHQIPELMEMVGRLGLLSRVKVGCAEPEQLPAIYAEQDLGFVLRDGDPVNRVSCPTKLSEYLAYGVVPIVSLVDIGDFGAMGYRYIALSDFLADKIPDHDTLNEMRVHNRAVFERVRQAHATGSDEVRNLRAPATKAIQRTHPGLFLHSLERCTLPLAGVRLQARFSDGATAEIAVDEALPQRRRSIELPLSAATSARTLTHLRYCPGPGPFVTSPIQVSVIDAEGKEHQASVQGNHEVDRFGNWVFLTRETFIEAALQVPGARQVRLDYEFLLQGPETWIAAQGLLAQAAAVASASPPVVLPATPPGSLRQRIGDQLRALLRPKGSA